MTTTTADLLKDFPTSSVNNSRDIIKHYLKKFEETPSEYYATKLEQFGITVDFSAHDYGEVPETNK